MEKVKSLVLALLVVTSLLQSYWLAFSRPQYDLVNQADYVNTELIGAQAELSQLIYPNQIIIHFAANKHTVLNINEQFYQMIYNEIIKRRVFDGFRRTSPTALNLNMDEIRNQHRGFEIRFDGGIPLNVLQTVMQIKEDVPGGNELITRIWIYIKDNKEEVRTLFMTDSSAVIYEAVKADVNVRDVERYVALGEFLTNYHTEDGTHYLPDEPLSMVRIDMPYSQYTPDQLKRSLFADPSLTRFLLDREGSQIYTDSKRGLQLKRDQHWFVYTDPVFSPVESKNGVKQNLLSAIQFINQHGGWNYVYRYSKVSPRLTTGPQTFTFRQIIDHYPIINLRTEGMGEIRISVQEGNISIYERSLIILENVNVQRMEAFLPGGKQLDDMFNNYKRKSMVVSLFQAYSALIDDDRVELVPRWAVELNDGSYDFL